MYSSQFQLWRFFHEILQSLSFQVDILASIQREECKAASAVWTNVHVHVLMRLQALARQGKRRAHHNRFNIWQIKGRMERSFLPQSLLYTSFALISPLPTPRHGDEWNDPTGSEPTGGRGNSVPLGTTYDAPDRRLAEDMDRGASGVGVGVSRAKIVRRSPATLCSASFIVGWSCRMGKKSLRVKIKSLHTVCAVTVADRGLPYNMLISTAQGKYYRMGVRRYQSRSCTQAHRKSTRIRAHTHIEEIRPRTHRCTHRQSKPRR